MSNKANERIVWVDALNVLACLGVLLLHCTNLEIHNFTGHATANYALGVFTHTFFIWPVDVFFMLTGYTLIRQNEPITADSNGIRRFYSRRLKRLLIPVLFWNITYTVLTLAVHHMKGEPMDDAATIALDFISMKNNSYMWFFVPLTCIYLTMPFLATFVTNASRQALKNFILISLPLGLTSAIGRMVEPEPEHPILHMTLFATEYLPFVVAGYYFGNFTLSRLTRQRIYWAALACCAIKIVGTVICHFHVRSLMPIFSSYTSVPCTIIAFAVFIWFRYADWDKICERTHIGKNAWATLASLSLGVYLIQFGWFKMGRFVPLLGGQGLLTFFAMYACCLSSIWVIKKIPFLRKVV